MDKEFSLKGDVALVTGSGRGLGHAIAVRLAELGADVAIHDYDDKAPAEFHEFRIFRPRWRRLRVTARRPMLWSAISATRRR
jgi:3-oxoacyl-[acyl-carrier protein] reductase